MADGSPALTGEYEITLRRDSRGGGKSERPFLSIDAIDLSYDRYVLLIHGWNTTADGAKEVYRSWSTSLLELASSLAGKIGFVYWPADKVGAEQYFSYPARVHTAIECAPDLAETLGKWAYSRGRFPEIVLIAHSLGARLLIETLKNLKPEQRATVSVVLMAAAYPVDDALDPATADVLASVRSMVLYSISDDVLRYTFPTAEWAAKLPGARRFEAVGLYGGPIETWGERRMMNRLGHNEYWQNDGVRRRICRFLGIPVAVDTPERELPSKSAPQSHDIDERFLAMRGSPAR